MHCISTSIRVYIRRRPSVLVRRTCACAAFQPGERRLQTKAVSPARARARRVFVLLRHAVTQCRLPPRCSRRMPDTCLPWLSGTLFFLLFLSFFLWCSYLLPYLSCPAGVFLYIHIHHGQMHIRSAFAPGRQKRIPRQVGSMYLRTYFVFVQVRRTGDEPLASSGPAFCSYGYLGRGPPRPRSHGGSAVSLESLRHVAVSVPAPVLS